jgi:hypothetical protein
VQLSGAEQLLIYSILVENESEIPEESDLLIEKPVKKVRDKSSGMWIKFDKRTIRFFDKVWKPYFMHLFYL